MTNAYTSLPRTRYHLQHCYKGCSCTVRGPINLAPRLYVVPAELAPFNDLFITFGTPLEFDATQYTTFLADLAAATDCKPLNGRDLEQALAVAQVHPT